MSSALARAAAAATRELELELAAEEQREVELTAQEHWARDPVGWINEHVWIATPFGIPLDQLPASLEDWSNFKRKLRPARMQLFPDQVATIGAWIDLDTLARTGELVLTNCAFEKSRQIGETWLFAALLGFLMHHHPVVLGVQHTDGGEVDDGGERNTPKSIFGKVRYIDRRLDRKRLAYCGQLRFRPFSRENAKIENPRNGAVAYGEGQSDDPFRGQTLDGYLADEAAFIVHGEKVFAAVDEACPTGKALLSTVNGSGNFHARIVDEKPLGWRVHTLHWSKHPIYSRGLHVAALPPDHVEGEPGRHAPQPADQLAVAERCAQCAATIAGIPWSAQNPRSHRYPGKQASPWYDWRVVGKTDEQVANELDIDRAGALRARVYREFVRQVHVVSDGIPYDPLLSLELAVDYGLDVTSVIFLQDAPMEVRAIGIVEMGDLYATSATPEAVAAELRRYAIEQLRVPAEHATPEWTLQWRGIGDPSGHGRSLDTGRTLATAYKRLGFSFGRPNARLTRSVETSITSVKRLLLGTPKPLRICGVNAGQLADHLENNIRETDAVGAPRIGARGAAPIRDDIHNHACRALAYWAVDRFPPIGERRDGPPALDDDEPAERDQLTYRRRIRGDGAPLGYGARL